MSADDIQKLAEVAKAQGVEIRIAPSGAVLIRPMSCDSRPSMTPAEKQRAYRERRKSVTEKVTLEPETVTNVTSVTSVTNTVTPPSPSLPPPPRPPEPPNPAHTRPPTPEGTRRVRTREDAADFTKACAVTLDLTASPALKAAWAEWQVYRQRLHSLTGTRRKDWTEQAANQSANIIARAVEQHGERIVLDRIATAIAGGWQGLNFDKLTTNGSPYQQSHQRFPAVSAPAKRPAQGERREGLSEFDV